MTPTRAQLDAAEVPQLKRYRTLVRHRRYVAEYLRAHARRLELRRCDKERATVATAIRAIRMARKGFDDTAAITPGSKNLEVL